MEGDVPKETVEVRLSTGSPGLDEIIGGGLPKNHLYMLEGDPGTGKTTLALQFLLAGARRGESCLYVTLAETESELRAVARSHGWTLDGIRVYEVSPDESELRPEEQYSAFHPAEVELGETVQPLLALIDEVKPARLVIDSLTEMKLLARDALRYRRQLVAFKQFVLSRGATALFLDVPPRVPGEHQLHTLAHGVIALERTNPAYGRERRRLLVTKLRGVSFHGGLHDYVIRPGGLSVYPCLVAAEHRRPAETAPVSSGLPELDALLDGGLLRGSSALLLGPAGAGKTTLSLQYALAAVGRGERAAIFSFDESEQSVLTRAKVLGSDKARAVEDGGLTVRQVDPASLSPGEFISLVRGAVERDGARIVVIDSLNGYLSAMPGEQYLVLQMHELLTYLAQQGVLTLLIVAQHGLVTSAGDAPVDVSYLADSILLLRYFESGGRVRKAISVLKKRGGPHEDSVREFQIDDGGIRVGEPLLEFDGVLTGVPRYHGPAGPLFGGAGKTP
jgi:circadian clock protein KaiC